MTVIDDIIKLKEKHDLVEEDATYEKQVEWYTYALDNGLVETEYSNSKLLGFYEYVRLHTIPKSLDELPQCGSDFVSGNIFFGANAISDSLETMWKLKHKVLTIKNRDVDYYVWHRKKNDKMMVFKNVRRK